MTPPSAPFPDNTVHRFVPSGDGVLHVTGVPGGDVGRPAVFMVPGYTDHAGRYGELFTHLSERGHPVWGMDLRGHGHSSGQRGYVRRFADYRDDLEAALEVARGETPGRRWVLLGHSTGGLIVLSWLLRRHGGRPPGWLAGCVLSCPLLALKLPVPLLHRLLGWLADRLYPRFSVDTGGPTYLSSHDAAMERAKRADPLVFTEANARWHGEAKREMAWVRARAAELEVPLLGIQAGADPVVDPEVNRRFFAACPHAAYRELPGLYHEVLLETGRAELFRTIGDWIEAAARGR